MTTPLTIFVLCHNRPDFARQTLHSIQAQTDRDFKLVVSDNSSNDEVARMLAKEFPLLECRRRVPVLLPFAHFNQCIEEIEGGDFCLFHDDDLMHPDFVKEMRLLLVQNPQAVAIGCNAHIESMGKIEPRTSFRALSRLEWVTSPRDLARRNFSRAQSGIAPFPSYIYRRSVIGDLRFDEGGGKYTDVAWLLNVVKKGPILWLNQPLMTYRIHGENEGSVESPRDRLRLMAFLKRNLKCLGKDLLDDYRCSFIYKPMLKNSALSWPRRQLTQRFLKHYGWVRYTRPSLYLSLIKRALIKRIAE